MTAKNVSGFPDWADPDDAPELTADMLADAEVYEGDRFVRRGPGRPVAAARKEAVTVRLDADVLASLRSGGPGWQTRLNAILRANTVDAARPARTRGVRALAGATLTTTASRTGGALTSQQVRQLAGSVIERLEKSGASSEDRARKRVRGG